MSGWHGEDCDQKNAESNRIEADISYHFANGSTSSFHFSSDTLNVSMGNGGLYDSIVADGFYVGHVNYMHFFIEPPDITTLTAGTKFPIRNFQSTNVCWQLLYQQSAADDVFYPMSQNLTDTITIDAIDLSKSILHASFASELINGYDDTAFIYKRKDSL